MSCGTFHAASRSGTAEFSTLSTSNRKCHTCGGGVCIPRMIEARGSSKSRTWRKLRTAQHGCLLDLRIRFTITVNRAWDTRFSQWSSPMDSGKPMAPATRSILFGTRMEKDRAMWRRCSLTREEIHSRSQVQTGIGVSTQERLSAQLALLLKCPEGLDQLPKLSPLKIMSSSTTCIGESSNGGSKI